MGRDSFSRAKATYDRQGFGLRMGFGSSPALLIIDMQNDFVGMPGLTAAPASAHAAIPHIDRLRRICLELGLSVIYTRGIVHQSRVDEGLWQLKSVAHRDGVIQVEGTRGAEICDALRPGPNDVVIPKRKPSAFFGTDLEVFLRGLGTDTLVITGSSASGCVRATVVDAFSREIRPILPREALVERDDIVLEANLFDMDAKYADVMSVEEVALELQRIGTALQEQSPKFLRRPSGEGG